jgi:hypothetical protein
VRAQLAGLLTSTLPEGLTDEVLKRYPLAVWVELAIGLDDAQELKRKKPLPFNEAVSLLSKDSGITPTICKESLERFLTHVSLPEKDRGGTGTGAFLAFKLHRLEGPIWQGSRPRRTASVGSAHDGARRFRFRYP